MTPAPLSPELEQRIEEEANEAAITVAWSQETHNKGDKSYVPKVDPLRKTFFKKGAIPYAELWQEAEQRAERYEKALKEIINNPSMDGYVLKKIANKALTPKTTNDE